VDSGYEITYYQSTALENESYGIPQVLPAMHFVLGTELIHTGHHDQGTKGWLNLN